MRTVIGPSPKRGRRLAAMSLVAGLLPFLLALCLRLFYSVALAWACVMLMVVGSIAAIVLATRARRAFQQEGSTPPERRVATAGLVLGIFSLVLLVLAPLALLIALVDVLDGLAGP